MRRSCRELSVFDSNAIQSRRLASLPSFLDQVLPTHLNGCFVVSLGDGQIKMIDCRESQRFSSSWTTDFSRKKSVCPPFDSSLGQTNHAGSGKAERTARSLPVCIFFFFFFAPLHGGHRYSEHTLFLHYRKAVSELPFVLYPPIPYPRFPHLHAAILLSCFSSLVALHS